MQIYIRKLYFSRLQPNSVQTQGCTQSIQTSTTHVATALAALQCSQAKKKKKIHILLHVNTVNEQAMLLNTKVLPASPF